MQFIYQQFHVVVVDAIKYILCLAYLTSCYSLLIEIVCDNLPTPPNGIRTFEPDTTSPFDYQTTVTYNCNTGFGLSGGNRVRSCQGSSLGPGEWTGTAPNCEGMFSLELELICCMYVCHIMYNFKLHSLNIIVTMFQLYLFVTLQLLHVVLYHLLLMDSFNTLT